MSLQPKYVKYQDLCNRSVFFQTRIILILPAGSGYIQIQNLRIRSSAHLCYSTPCGTHSPSTYVKLERNDPLDDTSYRHRIPNLISAYPPSPVVLYVHIRIWHTVFSCAHTDQKRCRKSVNFNQQCRYCDRQKTVGLSGCSDAENNGSQCDRALLGEDYNFYCRLRRPVLKCSGMPDLCRGRCSCCERWNVDVHLSTYTHHITEMKRIVQKQGGI